MVVFKFVVEVILTLFGLIANLLVFIFGVRLAVVIVAATVCYFCIKGISKLAIF